jgi:hypothetical protein
MIYDPVTDQVIIFGGRGMDQKQLHDTWLLNLNTLEWIQPAATKTAPHPQARDHVQMARDSLSGIIVMRGSSLRPGLPDETWHFNAHTRSWSLAQTNQEPQEMGHGSCARLSGWAVLCCSGSTPPGRHQEGIHRRPGCTGHKMRPGPFWMSEESSRRVRWITARQPRTVSTFFSWEDLAAMTCRPMPV